ncbi:MAG: R3H domain-containing nucleic acid-binding protein [Candidatus Gottesmanbacteria bacterium]
MDNKKLIQQEAEGLLKELTIEGTVTVEEKDGVFDVQIETTDTGILIGYHGETLSSFQLILSLIVYKTLQKRLSSGDGDPASKKDSSWLKIIVNVGDWRQRREESLQQMAQQVAEKVLATGEAVVLPNLSSFERRVIHLVLADHPQVETVSEGEGSERKLIIKLRNPA